VFCHCLAVLELFTDRLPPAVLFHILHSIDRHPSQTCTEYITAFYIFVCHFSSVGMIRAVIGVGLFIAACTCVVITGLCYLVTQQLTNYYTKTRLHDTSKVLVEFNIGFYVITSAGALSVVAVTCTLMRRSHVSSSRRRRCVSDLRQADSDIERIADIAGAMLPPAGRTPPPYRR